MSPVTKFEDHPAVSLILVKPGSSNPTSNSINLTPATASGDDTSRAAMMQLIYQLMLLIGDNMAQIQEINGKSQIDTAQIAQTQANAAQKSEHDLIKQLEKLKKKQEHAARVRIATDVFKWVGVAVALLVGALLCETPIGFVILAATIAFTASPLFNMTTNLIAKGLEDLGVPPSWAKIIAQVVLIVVITVASFGTEAATVGIKGGITAADDAGQAGAQAAMKMAQGSIEDAEGIEMQDMSQEVSTQASKTAENPKAPEESSSQVYRTSATTQVFLQSLMSSSAIPELISKIPGIKKYPWLVALLTILVEILAAVAAMKATPTSGAMNGLERLSSLTKLSPTLLRMSIASFATVSALGSNSATAYTGYNELGQSKTNKKIAPIQSQLLFTEGFSQILTQIATMAQQTYKQSMNANEAIFKIDFSSDMGACVAAQQQYQG